MPQDSKYGKVTTEFGNFGDDEPVVIFRARDVFLPFVLEAYQAMCKEAECPDHHVGLITNARTDIVHWQQANPDQVRKPTSDSHMARISENDPVPITSDQPPAPLANS